MTSLRTSRPPRKAITRQEFLRTIGLVRDPFVSPNAEKEVRSGKAGERPYFFSCTIDPKDPASHQSIITALQNARNGLVFGAPGSGKTALRYILEEQYRTSAVRRLTVTYDLGELSLTDADIQQHRELLARNLAIDLFIQVIERLNMTLADPTPAQIAALAEFLAQTSAPVDRALRRLQKEDFSTAEYGLSEVWPSLGRPVVKYVEPSPRITRFLNNLTAVLQKKPRPKASSNLFETGLETAKAWQFEQIAVLVDNVDTANRTEVQMLGLLTPLLEQLPDLQKQGVFFYFFLPVELEAPLARQYREIFNKALTFPPFWWIIRWDRETLAELLHERLRAGGSYISDFNALTASEFGGQLEVHLIKTSNGNPRQLLRIVSALIDAHLHTTPDRPVFTPADWQKMREHWSYDTPLPPFNLNGSSRPDI